ncbi:MAG TPA: type II secretion system protein [Gemmatimonadaceae bacterium]|nr:type II secretion system protein [Gemmatimonadaceae bacterium]
MSVKIDRLPRPVGRAGLPSARGFTLIELAIVLAIFGILGIAIGVTLVRQQRFYRGATELLYAREGVRDAMEVLSTDIRGMSNADTVRLLADSAIELFANIGSSVVCQRVTGIEIGLPATAARGNTLTAFTTQPDTGDLALFYRDSIENGSRWERHRIAAFGPRSLTASCPADTGFSAADPSGSRKGFVVTLAAPLSAHVASGAPVRFIRRGRFSLYRGSDGGWYLGYRRCDALGPSTCGAIQPLSGPYRAYSSDPGATGLLLEYFGPRGDRISASSPALSVARVDITARSESRQTLSVEGHAWQPSDWGTVSLAVRNRLP